MEKKKTSTFSKKAKHHVVRVLSCFLSYVCSSRVYWKSDLLVFFKREHHHASSHARVRGEKKEKSSDGKYIGAVYDKKARKNQITPKHGARKHVEIYEEK
jgi:hypothetical protein